MTKNNGENHPTTKYARQLVSGEIICCKSEKLLAKKHLRDLKRQGTKAFPYVFDESRADRFFKFFEMCRDPDRMKYYKILPHQQFEFGMLYGWVHRYTGIRKYKTVYKQESRANAKTTGCSIIAMNGLIADKLYPPGKEELGYIIPNAVIQLMAVDKDQVNELRDPICEITKVSPRISPRIEAKKTLIRGKKYGGKIKVLSKDPTNKQGGKPNLIIIDEYSSHTSSKRAEDARKGLGKKAQGMVYIITTAGDNEDTNPAKKEYDYAKKILSGEIIDESYLPIIRETESGDDIHDPQVWSKSTPMFRYRGKYDYSDTLFDTVTLEHKRAFEGNDLERQRLFKIYRLNIWQERSIKSYLDEADIKSYDECKIDPDEFKKLLVGKQCIAGFDFALRKDLTASGFIWQFDDDIIAIDAIGFMPLEAVKSHEQTDRIPYGEYIKLGILFTTLGNMTNRDEFAHIVCKKIVEYQSTIKEICYDPYKARECADDFISGKYDNLGAGMFGESNVIEIPQNSRTVHIPTTSLRDKIREKRIIHNGNPLLRWCILNAFEFSTKAGDLIRIGKENKDSNRRIDLAAAVINAFARKDSLKSDAWIERMSKLTDEFF